MSTDRRELILARLLVVAQTVADRVARNDTTITGRSDTAIVLWDGDETVPEEVQPRSRTSSPAIADMTPELRILREDPAADSGTRLNELRLLLIRAVLADGLTGGGLFGIIGSNGMIRYDGLSTERMPGRSMEGSLGVRFLVRYPLIYTELA